MIPPIVNIIVYIFVLDVVFVNMLKMRKVVSVPDRDHFGLGPYYNN